MSIIHAIDQKTDKVLGFLTNTGEKLFWADDYVYDIETGEHKFNFTMPANIPEAEYFSELNRVIIPDEDNGFEEFIIHDTDTVDEEKEVYTVPSYTEMDKDFVVEAGTYEGNLRDLCNIFISDVEYELGEIEYNGLEVIEVENDIGAYTFLKMVVEAFNAEIYFRIMTDGSEVIGRFIDIVQRIGNDNKKEIVAGKDLLGIQIKEHSNRIITALRVVGPKRDDGSRYSVLVTDDDAFQRWNRKGKHRIGIYFPQTTDKDITITKLTELGHKELQRRLASIFDYLVKAVSLEEKYPHEAVRMGDNVRVKNEDFSPPFYADARVIGIRRSIADTSQKEYRVGEVVRYRKEEVVLNLEYLLKMMNINVDTLKASKNAVFAQPSVPDLNGRVEGDVWYDTANGNRILVFDESTGDFEQKPLDYQALAVATLSAISANLGTVTAGHLMGVLIESATFKSSGISPYGIQMDLVLTSGLIRITANDKGARMDSNGFAISDFVGMSGEHDRFYVRLENTSGNLVIGSRTYNVEPGEPAIPGGPVEFDLQPNFNYQIKVKNGIRHEGGPIVTTQVEKSEFGLGGYGPAGITSSIVGQRVKFRTKKTYIPATISRVPVSTNITNVLVTRITADGFWAYIEGDGVAGYKYYDGEYTA